MLKVHPFGKYSHRQPLAYNPIRSFCSDVITVTDHFEDADIIIVAHSKDIVAHGEMLKNKMAKQQKLVLLSEEPFWDSVWATNPLQRHNMAMTPTGQLPYVFLNHHTSRIYDFIRIPYFLLTDEAYTERYAEWFRRNAHQTLTYWRNHFRDKTFNTVFLAEYRNEDRFDVCFPEEEIIGLSTLRTHIALKANDNRKKIDGTGWREGYRRQQLTDWHLDKFQNYNRQCRFFSAIENTHQLNYISEKIFDAFAFGAVPLYIGSPAHQVNDIVHPDSWINLWGLTADQADSRINSFDFNEQFLHSYADSQLQMALLFNEPMNRHKELTRLKKTLYEELAAS